MSLKKGMFESYVKEREAPIKDIKHASMSLSKYSHNRVFDEPASLKQASTLSNEFLKLEETFNETKHKPNTNQTQTTHTNYTQTTHKEDIKNTYQTQTTHKLHTKLNTQKTQTTHKLHTNYTQNQHISTLIGHQRKILLFIFEACKKARSRLTEPLTILHIANALEITLGSIKTSISRLCEKSFVQINSFKNGRGGWSVYEIPDYIYKELLQMETQHKLHTNYTQTTHKVDTKLDTQPNTTVSSSSSNSNNINKTTTLSDEWHFDISLYEKNLGFKLSHLRQLSNLNSLTATDVEQSLMEFNFDYENGTLPAIKTNKLNFLMGLLRTGNCYISENYRNEQEQAIKILSERAKKKKKTLLEEKFVIWETSLTEENRTKLIHELLSPHLMVEYKARGLTHPVKEVLLNYFVQNVKES